MTEMKAVMNLQHEVIKITLQDQQSALRKWQAGKGLIKRCKKAKTEDKAEEYLLWWGHKGSERCSFCRAVLGDCRQCPLFSGRRCHEAWNKISEAEADGGLWFVEVFEKQVPILYEAIRAVEEPGEWSGMVEVREKR